MDENLVGYLLKSLDPDTHRQVENYLRDDAGARRRLEQLRLVLEPLAADAEPPEPPPGLWVRTLAYIAQDRCRCRLPPAPPPVTVPAAPPRRWGRWADLLIAASVLLLLAGVGTAWLVELKQQHQIIACANNLRRIYLPLVTYANLHNGDFPRVEENPPRNVAGIFVPVLHDAGLGQDVNVACPGNGQPPPPRSIRELEELHARDRQAFREAIREMAGCYAYSLGYRQRGFDGRVRHCGLRRDSGDTLPIMADQPPFEVGSVTGGPGNSANHRGRGQNVLFIGGNVQFLKVRFLGSGDDIYLNEFRRVAAGEGPGDTVLGPSWASPYPPGPE
ncbi:MAG TPA: hypothetical protein VNK04_10700 [Gemmataceae bacterium]|jgi:hypothetical protein|nr:hypothetical protein [Gemmataceae bacterium]